MPRQNPSPPQELEPTALWEAHLSTSPLTATAARALKNPSVAAWLTSNEYLVADFQLYNEMEVAAAADKLAADLPLTDGSKLAYRAALMALRSPGELIDL